MGTMDIIRTWGQCVQQQKRELDDLKEQVSFMNSKSIPESRESIHPRGWTFLPELDDHLKQIKVRSATHSDQRIKFQTGTTYQTFPFCGRKAFHIGAR